MCFRRTVTFRGTLDIRFNLYNRCRIKLLRLMLDNFFVNCLLILKIKWFSIPIYYNEKIVLRSSKIRCIIEFLIKIGSTKAWSLSIQASSLYVFELYLIALFTLGIITLFSILPNYSPGAFCGFSSFLFLWMLKYHAYVLIRKLCIKSSVFIFCSLSRFCRRL